MKSLFAAWVLLAGCGDEASKHDAGGPADAGVDAGDAGDDAGVDAGPPCPDLALERLTEDLSFPVFATAPPGDDRIFVLERFDGVVVILRGGVVEPTPFLDVSAETDATGYEAGILSLAFHPDFAANGRVYVGYTTLTDTFRISRFEVPPGTPDAVDPLSESLVIEFPQLTHHNTSGMMVFGPDGMLYIALGDDDVEANGQDLAAYASKILRIDVDSAEPYAVPPDNPFVGAGAVPETFVWGLREPYRIWFDETGDLYIADVGHHLREEVDVVPAGSGGQNFGWPDLEGTICHTPPEGCETADRTLPVYEYTHDYGQAIIGASTVRGGALPACWQGRYVFGDYPSGAIRSFRWEAPDDFVTDIREEPNVSVPSLVSFGVDGAGEILVVGFDQTLDRIVAAE